MSIQTKKKSTVGIAIAAIGAAAITLGAGTFAFFSLTVGPTTTNAAAGTVVLTQGTSTGSFNLSGLVPGGPSTTNTLSYTNGGTGPATLNLALAVAGTEDGCTGDEALPTAGNDLNCSTVISTPTAGAGDLSGLLKVTVTKSVNGGPAIAVGTPGPVSGLPPIDTTPALAGGGTVVYTFVYSFPDGGASDNIAQGDGSIVTATASLQS